MKVNQRRIAELAGVSYATVSRALSSGKVSAEKMKRIEEAMRSLNYDVSGSKTQNSRLVMVIAGDVAESFFANIIRGICNRLQKAGFFPVLCNSDFDGAVEAAYIRAAEQASYAGVIMITAVESAGLVDLIRSLRIPLIFVNRYIRSLNQDEVCVDNFQGAYLAVEHLLAKGHKRIAHLAGPDYSTATQDRLNGYRTAMYDAGIEVPERYILYGDLSSRSGYEAAPLLLDKDMDFSAVFVSNAQMSFGMLNYFFEHSIKVPDRLSVICHDELPQVTEGPFRLTTVSHDPYLLGVEAANVFMRRVEEPGAERIRIFYSPHLVERSSVAAYGK